MNNEEQQKINCLSKRLVRHALKLEEMRAELRKDLAAIGETWECEALRGIVGNLCGNLQKLEVCVDGAFERVAEFLPETPKEGDEWRGDQ